MLYSHPQITSSLYEDMSNDIMVTLRVFLLMYLLTNFLRSLVPAVSVQYALSDVNVPAHKHHCLVYRSVLTCIPYLVPSYI